MTEITVIIPAFNEERRIPPTLRTVVKYLARHFSSWEVLVIDDGSSDQTRGVVGEFAKDHPGVTAHGFADNRGKGAAVREGVRLATGRAILFLDADGAIPIDELPKLMVPLENGAPVVIGSKSFRRAGSARHFKWRRLFMGRIFNLFVRIFLVRGVRDSQCGFKLFEAEAAKQLFRFQKMDGFSFDMEILYLARLMDIPFAEVLVRWRDIGGSRINLLSDSWRMFLDIFKIRALHASVDYRRQPHDEISKP